ncbi:MAG: AAA family ATPase [Gaiellaceae bacterium]
MTAGDVRGLFADLGVDLPHGGPNVGVRCFANPGAHRHNDRDRSASLNVESGVWCCHGCSAKGGAYDAALALGRSPADAMRLLEARGLVRHDGDERPVGLRNTERRDERPARHRFPEAIVQGYADALLANAAALRRLEELRGWTAEAIRALGIGLDGDRVTIPARDATGALVGITRYQPNVDRRNGAPKLKADRGSRRELFPPPETLTDAEGWVLLVEGEPDVAAAVSCGLSAVGVPGVEGWRSEWAERFRGRRVAVWFDADAAGRLAAGRVAADLASVVAEVRLVDHGDHRDDGYDLTDLLRPATTPELREETRQFVISCIERTPRFVIAGRASDTSPARADVPAVGEPAGDDRADRDAYAIEVHTARDLMALPEPTVEAELLGSAVVHGYRTIIGGATGEGKTVFVLDAIKAITTGGELLGWGGAGGRALILDLEQGLRTVKKRLREAGLEDSDRVDLSLIPDGLALDSNAEHVAALERVLERGRYDVVVLDAHYKAHQGEANAEREMVDMMRRLDGWRARFGFALILPVHLRKPVDPKAGTKMTIHDIFGSTAITRGAEVVQGIQRVEHGYSRLYFFKDRDGDLPVGLDPWGLLYGREEGFRRDPRDLLPERDYAAELRELGGDHEWRTVNEWKAAKKGIGAGQEAVKGALAELVAAGSFEYMEGPPGRQPSAKCWRFRPDERVTRDVEVTPGNPGDALGDEAGYPTAYPPEGGVAARSPAYPADSDVQVTPEPEAA